jgi:DNA-binding MarR family transcriptional regulator
MPQTARHFDPTEAQCFGKTPWYAFVDDRLTRGQKLIIGYIDGFAFIYGESPEVREIALDLGLHRGTVLRELHSLEAAGYLSLPIDRDGRMRPKLAFDFKGKSTQDHASKRCAGAAPRCAGAAHPRMLPTNKEAPARRCRKEKDRSEEIPLPPLTTTTNPIHAPAEPEVIPLAPALVAPPEPTPPAPSLTEGQAAFLAGLSPDERARFDGWPVERRAKALAPHARGLDPVIARDCRSKLAPPSETSPATIPVLTVPEVLGQVAAGDVASAGKAAEWMCRDFGLPADRGLWGQFNLIVMAIGRGRLNLADVIEAYNQAVETDVERRKRNLPPVKNRGAKFWSALKCRTGLREGDLQYLAAGLPIRC